MKKLLLTTLILMIGLLIPIANAAITSVTGPVSSAGTAPAIILHPNDALDDNVTNTGMQGFNEAKIVTTVDHAVDGGVIPAGSLVASHMIFLNSEGDTPLVHGGPIDGPVVWTFTGPILGVMSDGNGNLESASTFELGALGTNYTVAVLPDRAAPFPLRGMEHATFPGFDSYLVTGNEIAVNMGVVEPGDWVRVVTLAPGSQGYWKNNPDVWPVEEIVIGDIPYPKDDAIGWMKTPTKGDKTISMFQQLVAAKLNILNGCCEPCIPDCIATADVWMAEYGPVGEGVKASSDAWRDSEALLFKSLEAYNNDVLMCD